MTPNQLKIIISNELCYKGVHTMHGISKENIDKLLLDEPKIIDLIDFSKKIEQYWLVLDELPDDLENGYFVVYDERNETFGLATKTTMNNKSIGYLVGLYGSFIDALNNM